MTTTIFFFFILRVGCGAQASPDVEREFRCPKTYEILVSWPGIEPTATALEGRYLITGQPGSPTPPLF